jgi:HEAT repeat protein
LKVNDLSYDEKQLKLLLKNLKDRDGWVRSEAASRLGEIKAKEAVDELVKLLQEDRDSLVRSHAAAALGDLGEEAEEAVKSLVETLKKDMIVGVRLEAAVALGNIGSEEAIPELTKIAMEDKDIRVRSWAADAIRKIRT